MAKEHGFDRVWVSDHFHPWTDRQGQSPFVWSVLGAMAQAAPGARLGTGVTCPTIRIHPAIIAQATATMAVADSLRQFGEAGFDEIYVHQIGSDQEPFLRFYRDEVIPRL